MTINLAPLGTPSRKGVDFESARSVGRVRHSNLISGGRARSTKEKQYLCEKYITDYKLIRYGRFTNPELVNEQTGSEGQYLRQIYVDLIRQENEMLDKLYNIKSKKDKIIKPGFAIN